VKNSEFDPSPPIYVSEKSAKNFWQDYRVYPDRIELRCWIVLKTFVIPAQDIVEIKIRPAFSLREDLKLNWWALKLDWSDLCEHVQIHRKTGWIRYLRITPDNPMNFVAACRSLKSPEMSSKH
jgi:hypothetical protein